MFSSTASHYSLHLPCLISSAQRTGCGRFSRPARVTGYALWPGTAASAGRAGTGPGLQQERERVPLRGSERGCCLGQFPDPGIRAAAGVGSRTVINTDAKLAAKVSRGTAVATNREWYGRIASNPLKPRCSDHPHTRPGHRFLSESATRRLASDCRQASADTLASAVPWARQTMRKALSIAAPLAVVFG